MISNFKKYDKVCSIKSGDTGVIHHIYDDSTVLVKMGSPSGAYMLYGQDELILDWVNDAEQALSNVSYDTSIIDWLNAHD